MPVPGYTLGEVLGEGAFAQTRIGHHNDRPDQPVAVKSIRRSHPRFELESIQKEIAVMQRIDHPRCVNLLEVAHSIGRLLACARRVAALLRCPAETVPALASPDAACRQVHEDETAIHMVEELGAGGELFDRIIELGKFSEADAVHLIHQVVDGIQYLHSMGCIHRDLKPENLLMVGRTPGTDEYLQLKICDFGLSAMREVDGTKEEFNKDLQKYMGTEEYIAPEVFITASSLAKQRAGEHYTGKIDVWAIGVIFYIMVTGRFPFARKDHEPLYIVQQICKGSYDKECMDRLSEDSKAFIYACLTLNPDQVYHYY
jgi:serine/threonine protein kinase